MLNNSPQSTFLALPRELRDLIYGYCGLDYPDVNETARQVHRQIAEINRTLDSHDHSQRVVRWPRVKFPRLVTPTVLLLNRRTTFEALDLLHSRTWRLEKYTGNSYYNMGRGPEIWHYIGEQTLQNMRHVKICMDFRGDPSHPLWYWTVETLIKIWRVRNRLVSVHVRIENPGDVVQRGDSGRNTAGDTIALLQIFGVEVPVTFEGCNVGVVAMIDGEPVWLPD